MIDPFMGSGSVGVAAVRLGRNFLGNDTCDEAVRISEERLREAGAQLWEMNTDERVDGEQEPQLGMRF